MDNKLSPIIEELLYNKHYVSFLIGRNGEFDEYAASVIKRTQKNFGKEKSDISLVLPYKVSKIEYYEKYYDDIIIYEAEKKPHPKRVITERNKFMIDMVIL